MSLATASGWLNFRPGMTWRTCWTNWTTRNSGIVTATKPSSASRRTVVVVLVAAAAAAARRNRRRRQAALAPAVADAIATVQAQKRGAAAAAAVATEPGDARPHAVAPRAPIVERTLVKTLRLVQRRALAPDLGRAASRGRKSGAGRPMQLRRSD